MANEIYKINLNNTDYSVTDNRIITLQDNSTTTAGTWKAKTDKITALADGQMFYYKIVKAGASTTTLNITNSAGTALGAKTIYKSNTKNLTDIYDVGSYVLLSYNSTNDCFRLLNDSLNNYESYLSWGGRSIADSYGPIDAAMVPELGANRLAFIPSAAVDVHYSRDGGSTWTDYGLSAADKINLFNGIGSTISIGKNSSTYPATNQYQARVSIYTGAANVYTALNKFVIYISTGGSTSNWCTIRARTENNRRNNVDTWTTFASKTSVGGWSGYNVINISSMTTYGNTPSSQFGEIQFIFGCDGGASSTYPGMRILKIFGFGGVGWITPSTMANTGHMYTYDSSKNVTFPAKVSAKSFSENGTLLSDKYADKSVATTSAKGLMSTADKTKLDGIASGATNVVESTVSGWGFTKNSGTITGIKMNGSSKGTSGVVDLGTVITSHQDISGKADKASGLTGATKCKITYNSSGIVTGGSNLAATDIPDLAASKITSGTFADARIASASTWNGKYTKPSAGIPASDLTSSVQSSLIKADDAVPKHDDELTPATKCKISYDKYGLITGGSDLAATDIPELSADKITSGTLATARIPSLAASKITSGTLPDARIASAATWNAKGTYSKPSDGIPESDLSTTFTNKLQLTANLKTDVDANKTSDTYYPSCKAVANYVGGYHDTTKQDTLVSGTSIKTINGVSVLGSGNIEVGGGGGGSNWTLLWTNASPSSSFAAQTLTLSTSGYTKLAITLYQGATIIIDKSNTVSRLTDYEYDDGDSISYHRPITTVSDAKLVFAACKGTTITSGGSISSATKNGSCKPYKIYGFN